MKSTLLGRATPKRADLSRANKNEGPELLERVLVDRDATGNVERVNEAGAAAAANSE